MSPQHPSYQSQLPGCLPAGCCCPGNQPGAGSGAKDQLPLTQCKEGSLCGCTEPQVLQRGQEGRGAHGAQLWLPERAGLGWGSKRRSVLPNPTPQNPHSFLVGQVKMLALRAETPEARRGLWPARGERKPWQEPGPCLRSP